MANAHDEATVEFAHPRELTDWIGREIGVSGWRTIDQAAIDAFADTTGDHQWIHVDRARAARELATGTTIAHGYLVLSMLAGLSYPMYRVTGARHVLNYGLDRVRFTAPVPAGARVRLRLGVRSVDERADASVMVVHDATIELAGSERPACVAQNLRLFVM